MAWWVKNHIAVNDDETQQLCSVEADTQTSLPAADQTATAGFIIVRGSDAQVLDTGDRYIMNSGGTWIQQPSGVQLDLSGYATTQDLTDGLAGKADNGTFQLAIAGAPLSASLYYYSCITTGDIATVCIRIVLAAELDVSTSTLLFQLPAGYYPGITVAGMGYADTKLRTIWINSSGEIRIKVDEAVPAGTTIIASFCYSFRSSNWKTVTPNSAQSAASLMQAGRIDTELSDAQEVTDDA